MDKKIEGWRIQKLAACAIQHFGVPSHDPYLYVHMTDHSPRIRRLISYLKKGIYEKETEITLSLLAALSGESILLLGPPGVAKSMVASRLKEAFFQARSFDYLMSRFSIPDELFGPVSIARLKEDDSYERVTEGYLPTADVVFLDEIWKAGPAIQNTLLTVMNEKRFRNGRREEQLPLKLLVAASNELPAKGEGLEALWDRFLIRLVSHNIECDDTFSRMICDTTPVTGSAQGTSACPDALTAEEYARWQSEAQQVKLAPTLLKGILALRQQLQQVSIEGNELPRHIYVSDRRWRHIAGLLRTSAYICGRSEASEEDLLPLYHCLWNEPDEIPVVQRLTIQVIFAPLVTDLEHLSRVIDDELQAARTAEALHNSSHERAIEDKALAVIDRLYYQIDNHGTGHTYIYITDYKLLPEYRTGNHLNTPLSGQIHPDPHAPERRLIRPLDPSDSAASLILGAERVTLARSTGAIYINGIRYPMRLKGHATLNPSTGKVEGMAASDLFAQETAQTASAAHRDQHEAQIEDLCDRFEALQSRISDGLFISPEDNRAVAAFLKPYHTQIALTRAALRRLLYDEG